MYMHACVAPALQVARAVAPGSDSRRGGCGAACDVSEVLRWMQRCKRDALAAAPRQGRLLAACVGGRVAGSGGWQLSAQTLVTLQPFWRCWLQGGTRG